MTQAQGGCLCGDLRYEVAGQPERMTVCHCRFCQRATGGAFMVEPIFAAADVAIIMGVPKIYTHVSAGSGLQVHVHFCARCGTKIYLTFERFDGIVGLYGGTLDDPKWLAVPTKDIKHIFLNSAQHGVVIPAHVKTFQEHATKRDGTPITPKVFEKPHVIGRS